MILVTGGLGFIGTQVARELTDFGEEVVLTRHHTVEVPEFLVDRVGAQVHVEPVDVTSAEGIRQLLERYRVDGVIHLATPPRHGVTAVQEMQIAVDGLLAVFDACGRAGIKRLSVASSLRAYGDPASPPARENQALSVAATSAIQASKLAEESLGSYLARTMDIDAVFLRIAVIYGPGYRTLLNVPSRLCHLAAGHPERIAGMADPLEGEPDDAWDICYVKDCARAIRLVQLAPDLSEHVYNIGSGEKTTLAQLLNAISAATSDTTFQLRSTGREPIDPGAAMDIGRLRRDVGYEPKWETKGAVADYVDWLADHER